MPERFRAPPHPGFSHRRQANLIARRRRAIEQLFYSESTSIIHPIRCTKSPPIGRIIGEIQHLIAGRRYRIQFHSCRRAILNSIRLSPASYSIRISTNRIEGWLLGGTLVTKSVTKLCKPHSPLSRISSRIQLRIINYNQLID